MTCLTHSFKQQIIFSCKSNHCNLKAPDRAWAIYRLPCYDGTGHMMAIPPKLDRAGRVLGSRWWSSAVVADGSRTGALPLTSMSWRSKSPWTANLHRMAHLLAPTGRKWYMLPRITLLRTGCVTQKLSLALTSGMSRPKRIGITCLDILIRLCGRP